MRKLSNEEITKNHVDTINQFNILKYLKTNIDIYSFDVYLYDRNTIKLIDKNNDTGYFTYEKQEVLFKDNINHELER